MTQCMLSSSLTNSFVREIFRIELFDSSLSELFCDAKYSRRLCQAFSVESLGRLSWSLCTKQLDKNKLKCFTNEKENSLVTVKEILERI